jgi:enoyl-CoA hydratase/carnithine racemase
VSDYQTIRYQRDGDIGTLTLARPGKRNAQNPLMWQELARLGAGLLPDQTLRCLVVTGEGPAFSAGIDLVEGMAGLLAGVAGRPGDERSLAAGRAVAGTFSWIPATAAPASPPSGAMPTARACSWPWRATSASSPKAPRWA